MEHRLTPEAEVVYVFFNSQNKRALEFAKRYGRMPDAVAEVTRLIIEEQNLLQKAFMNPDCIIVNHNAQLQTAKWGLIPFWVREVEKAESISKMTANAKAETVFTLPSFREAIRKRRCLIPSTGFYEYHHTADRGAVPYRMFLRDTDVFSLAGVYEKWRNPATKEKVRTFSILTVPANVL